MNKPTWITRLKTKWNIQTDRDFWMIILTFSLAGMFITFARRIIFHLVGIKATTPLWVKVVLYIPLVPPSYYLGLLFFGTVLGQFAFFWEWEKNMLRRLRLIRSKKPS